MQQEMDNKVLVDRTLWWDATKPAILLSPDEVKRAYVEVDGHRVKLSDIPAEDRAQIIQARQSRRLPVGEMDIARSWLRANGEGCAPRPEPVPELRRRETTREEPPAAAYLHSGAELVAKTVPAAVADAASATIGVAGAVVERALPQAWADDVARIVDEMQRSKWLERSRVAAKRGDRGRASAADDQPEISKAARMIIERELRTAGIPVTPEAVAEVYRRKRYVPG